MGINGMMKSFIGQKKFRGAYKEDLDGIIEVYDMIADMCVVTYSEKRKASPFMLKGDALSMFSRNATSCRTYAEAITILRHLYNSS